MAEVPNSKQAPLESASAKLLFSLVNVHVKVAMQAVRTKDSRSLHFAFLNIGVALGVDKAITDIVKSYTKHLHAPRESGRDLRNTRLIFHKDWNHLEAMVADVPLEEKINHAREFMRSRQIPRPVVFTLHVPNRTIKHEDSSDEEVRVGSACQIAEKSKDQKISLVSKKLSQNWDRKEQHKDSETRVNAREYESKTRSDKLSQSDSKRSDSTNDARSKVSSQDTKSSAHQKSSGRTKGESENKKLSRDKLEKILRKDSETRASEDESKSHSIKSSPSDSRRSDSTNDSRSKVSSPSDTKSSAHQNDSVRTKERSENKKLSRDKVEKIERKDSDSRKRSRDDKSEPRNNKRQASDYKRLDSTNTMQSKVSGRFEKKSTDVVDVKTSSRRSNDKIVHKYSPDNCKPARGDKSETCSTNRSESHSKRSNSKDSVQKSEATKSSAPKNTSIRTTDADNCKKSSRNSDVTSSGKAEDNLKRDGEVAENEKSSPHCKEDVHSCESFDSHVTKLVIQNLHPLVDEMDISMIFSDFKSYKSCKVNFYDYGRLCAADVVFEKEADAVEARNQFDGKKLDGFPIHIAVIKSEKI